MKPSTRQVEIDHSLYLRSRPYRRTTHAALRRLGEHCTGLSWLQVWHEDDGSCCACEEWTFTALRIMRSLAEDGVPVMWVGVG